MFINVIDVLNTGIQPRLTSRQQQCADFIVSFAARHDGRVPTTREIGDALGIKSAGGVQRLVTEIRVRCQPNGAPVPNPTPTTRKPERPRDADGRYLPGKPSRQAASPPLSNGTSVVVSVFYPRDRSRLERLRFCMQVVGDGPCLLLLASAYVGEVNGTLLADMAMIADRYAEDVIAGMGDRP